MNLYLFNETDKAAVYGIGTYIDEVVTALTESSIHLHIVHLRSEKSYFEIIKTESIENWYIPDVQYKNPYLDSVQEIENYYSNVIYLLRLHIKDTKGLAFHLNYNQSHALAKGLKETFDCKVIATVHYLKWQLQLSGNLTCFQLIRNKTAQQRNDFEQTLVFVDEYERLLFNTVDKIILLAQHTYNIFCAEYGINANQITVIPNGLADIQPTGHSKRIRQKYRLNEDAPLLLFAGRLDQIKGVDYALQGFNRILETYPQCHLIIAGNGNYDPYLKQCGDNWMNIHFTGRLDKDRLYELYSITDIGLMPSFHEQCSYVAIELMMHGVPLIASTTTGLKEMVEDGGSGLHIPVIEHPDKVEIDIGLFAQKILYLLDNPEERKRMGRNARKRYETTYSAEIFRESLSKFYCSLLMKN